MLALSLALLASLLLVLAASPFFALAERRNLCDSDGDNGDDDVTAVAPPPELLEDEAITVLQGQPADITA